jgi:uncharacterized circularly permuted ATP-grasp superfamily protein
VPRIISAREWQRLTRGIEQRVRAINAFLHDIYHRQEILRAGRVPVEMIARNDAFLPQMIGVTPAGRRLHPYRRHRPGAHRRGRVLRAGGQCAHALGRVLHAGEPRDDAADVPGAVQPQPGAAGADYPADLRRSLAACAPPGAPIRPTVAVLTPGIFNSAYFEHAFLADQMGVELVEGHDLRVSTARRDAHDRGLQAHRRALSPGRRRFLDPLNFNPDSALGVPGIMDVYRAGGITIANAPGTGIADDKAIYSYMPEIVEFYTGEKGDPANVPTWRCSEPDALAYVLDNLDRPGGQGGARLGRLRHAGRARRLEEGARGVPQES